MYALAQLTWLLFFVVAYTFGDAFAAIGPAVICTGYTVALAITEKK